MAAARRKNVDILEFTPVTCASSAFSATQPYYEPTRKSALQIITRVANTLLLQHRLKSFH